MKINIHSINPTLILELTGGESWLKTIYNDYQKAGQAETKPLTGRIRLHEEEAGTYLVTGNISFVASQPCDLCQLGLTWPVELTINTRYLPETTNAIEREKNLSRADLDAYYIEEGHIDLEVLINDAINDVLPTRFLKIDADGNCLQCGKDLNQERVWSSQDERTSPFAVLKDVKVRN